VLFLAIGAGAIFQVTYEITKLIRKDTTREPMPLTIFSGVVAGMLLLWVTGLLIKQQLDEKRTLQDENFFLLNANFILTTDG